MVVATSEIAITCEARGLSTQYSALIVRDRSRHVPDAMARAPHTVGVIANKLRNAFALREVGAAI